jgi:hypothetical protein
MFLPDLLNGPELPRGFTKTGDWGLFLSLPGLARSPGSFVEKTDHQLWRRIGAMNLPQGWLVSLSSA